jgi:hypothetical protein
MIPFKSIDEDVLEALAVLGGRRRRHDDLPRRTTADPRNDRSSRGDRGGGSSSSVEWLVGVIVLLPYAIGRVIELAVRPGTDGPAMNRQRLGLVRTMGRGMMMGMLTIMIETIIMTMGYVR